MSRHEANSLVSRHRHEPPGPLPGALFELLLAVDSRRQKLTVCTTPLDTNVVLRVPPE
jgi:hypothetical protein